MESGGKPSRRLATLAVLALGGFGLLFVLLERGQILQVAWRANWWVLILALALTAVSYACLSYSFAAICKIFGVRLGRRDLFEIGFVSWALNHLVSVGGAAGYSLRMLLVRRLGLPVGDVVAASLFHSALNDLMLLLLAPVGLIYLLLVRPLNASMTVGLGAAAGFLLALVVLFGAVIFAGRVRKAALRAVSLAWMKVFRHDISGRTSGFDATVGRGISEVRNRPGRLAAPLALVFFDWASCVGALWFCFDALGGRIGPGVLLTGFVVGVVAGLVSMVPGGLGVQDGSMTAVYVLLGVPLTEAALAAVLFRLVYYVVPFLVSLTFYRRLLMETTQKPQFPAHPERALRETGPEQLETGASSRRAANEK